MKIIPVGEPQIIMDNPLSKHNYFGWPTVERLKNDRIAVVASGFRLHHVCPFGKTVMAISEDEGETYTRPMPIIDTVLDDRDGGILAFGESGVIVTSFNNTRAMQRGRLTDQSPNADYISAYLDKVTDEEEKRDLGSTFRISHNNGVTFGPIHKSPITSPHGPTELRDGTILWVGRSYSNDDNHMDSDKIHAYTISVDGTMEYRGSIENIPSEDGKLLSCEPHAIQLQDGRILCHIRVQRYGEKPVFTTYQSESADGGYTWSEPVRILDIQGGAPAHLLQLEDGLLISTYGYRQPPYGVKVMFSTDGGKTWDVGHDLYINGYSSDLGYPATITLKDGSFLTVFYARPHGQEPAEILQQKWRIEK